MIKINDWMDMPQATAVVELEPGEVVIPINSIEQLQTRVEHLIHRNKYYDDNSDLLEILEEIQDELKLLHMQGEHA